MSAAQPIEPAWPQYSSSQDVVEPQTHAQASYNHHTTLASPVRKTYQRPSDAAYFPYTPSRPADTGHGGHLPAGPPSRRSRSNSPSDQFVNTNSLLHTALGAGRLDPFQVYCKQDLPLYVHEVLDHFLHHVCCTFTLASEGVARDAVKNYVMGHAMVDPLTWYAIILAGVTHYMYVNGERGIPNELTMLRLSYKTQAMGEIRAALERTAGNIDEGALFAINTLAAHGGAYFSKDFRHDRIQSSKAFGSANQMNYYSTIPVEWEHWNMMIRLVRQRGGPSTLSNPAGIPGFPPSPGPGCLTTNDTIIAWRHLRCPEFPLVVNTNKVVGLQPVVRDATAQDQSRTLLSGFPNMPKNSMHFRRLHDILKNVRTLIVDYAQFQRGQAPALDLRLLYWTRLMLLHDLLLLPDLDMSDNALDLLYELCRKCLLALMQLVLCPVVASNLQPQKILKLLLPVIRRSTTAIHGRTLDREHPSLFLWAVTLAGMLAMEHYLTHSDSAMLDEVSAHFDRVSLKAEKNSWPLATNVLQTFLWLESECDGPGQRYWNYACLWLAERRHGAAREEG